MNTIPVSYEVLRKMRSFSVTVKERDDKTKHLNTKCSSATTHYIQYQRIAIHERI